jgi:hypothetical protein
MSAVLRASGVAFDPEEYVKTSALPVERVWRRGESRRRGLANHSSGLTVVISNADMTDLRQQVDDAVLFLRAHRQEVARLVACPGVEQVTLDFGVSWKDGVVSQTDSLSAELVGLSGALGLSIDVSHYATSDD